MNERTTGAMWWQTTEITLARWEKMKTVKKALSAQMSGPGPPDGLESTITLKTFLNFEIPITMAS